MSSLSHKKVKDSSPVAASGVRADSWLKEYKFSVLTKRNPMICFLTARLRKGCSCENLKHHLISQQRFTMFWVISVSIAELTPLSPAELKWTLDFIWGWTSLIVEPPSSVETQDQLSRWEPQEAKYCFSPLDVFILTHTYGIFTLLQM